MPVIPEPRMLEKYSALGANRNRDLVITVVVHKGRVM